MKKLFVIIALFFSIQSFAQIETDTHVFWQPGAKLTFDMFQGAPPDSAFVKKVTDLIEFPWEKEKRKAEAVEKMKKDRQKLIEIGLIKEDEELTEEKTD